MSISMDPSKISKGKLTQQLIIDKAISLFSKYGYDRTSFQMIADEIDISRAAPLYHFKNKSGLFEATVRYIVSKKDEDIAQLYDLKDDAYSRLLKHVRATVSWFIINKSQAEVLLLLYYYCSIENRFAALYHEILQNDCRVIEEVLLAGKREKCFHFTAPSEQLARTMSDALVGFCVNALAGRKKAEPMKSMEHRLTLLVNLMVKYET